MATGEGAAERFKRLAEARVNKALKDVQLIANLSHKGNYTYTQGDVDKIFRALEKELKAARAKFEGVKGEDDTRFRL